MLKVLRIQADVHLRQIPDEKRVDSHILEAETDVSLHPPWFFDKLINIGR